MSTPPDDARSPRGRVVPSGRLSRFGHFGRLAGGVAGGMIAEGARRIDGLEVALSNSMGLGGHNGCTVLRRYAG